MFFAVGYGEGGLHHYEGGPHHYEGGVGEPFHHEVGYHFPTEGHVPIEASVEHHDFAPQEPIHYEVWIIFYYFSYEHLNTVNFQHA